MEGDHVSSATYPLPQPLVERLQAGILLPRPVTTSGGNAADEQDGSASALPPPAATSRDDCRVESLQDGLACLVGNCIEAMDAMYFATPAHIRNHEAFTHRLCFRVTTHVAEKSLSITDLGVGMTRTDLINSLGIGKVGLSAIASVETGSSAPRARSFSMATDSTTDDDFGSSDFEADFGGDNDDGDAETDNGDPVSEGNGGEAVETAHQHHRSIDCRASKIGGFYAALIALGTGVKVSTKSSSDDYYMFELGMEDTLDSDKFQASLGQFRVSRPLEEGTALSAQTGFDQFHHVRDTGTCVTLRLNQAALDQGLLDEEKLKSMMLKIVETTQYTVAFSSDENSQEIIDASAVELEMIQMQKSLDESKNSFADLDIQSTSSERADKSAHESLKERVKYIPLRLSLGERKMLRLVEAAMYCCDYTTQVDKPFKSAARRTHEQLKGVTSVLRGMVTACDYEAGQKLDDNYAEYESFFRQIFEITRRHKIQNPEKMRTEYGKLIYLLQDAVSPSVRPHLGFSVTGPIETVYKFLEEQNGLDMLNDELVVTATEEILAGGKSRATIDSEIRVKERAVNVLKRKYQTPLLSADDIHLCLYSICDNNSFLNSNRVPIDKVIEYLTSHFSPTTVEEGYSLGIVSGEQGARLSHSHERHYYYVFQSLTLWRDIVNDMFRLWTMAEEDLLSEVITYSLQDTGQGYQRVQQSPKAYKAMQQLLARVQTNHHFVGSSVIHMGDHNVPNALSFIDKYTQVPRILGPIVSCLENLERIYKEDEGIRFMVDSGFGGLEKLRKDILYDFFRFAFDGSGSDISYDAGNCVDGRLTSAWNWCSHLPDKPFYAIFRLTGFAGFDGEFR